MRCLLVGPPRVGYGSGHTGGVTARFPVEVERFAVVQHEAAQIVLDELGMFTAVRGSGLPGTGLVKVADLTAKGSFCLLGEPGAGKTTALQGVVRGAVDVDRAPPGQDAVLWIPLGEVADSATFRERVTVRVLNSIAALRTRRLGGLTVVLDGLDECPVSGGGKVLAALLKDCFGAADVAGLRVIVGCRSAEYPQSVHEVLAGALGSFTRYELAPLTQRDVRELTASRGADADEFLREVARTRTGPLASLPLSLEGTHSRSMRPAERGLLGRGRGLYRR
jgi:hypothetical protein